MLKIVNPATQAELKELREDSPKSIERKVVRAGQAALGWGQLPLGKRLQTIERFAGLLTQERDRLAKLLTEEMGKPITQARSEIEVTVKRAHYFLEHVPIVMAQETITPADKAARQPQEHVTYEPLGCVTQLSAWNYPYFTGSNVFLPALLCGDAVLYKPSEYATLSGLEMSKLLWQAGVPEDIFVPIVGGPEVGKVLLEQDTQALYFTGSYKVGIGIAAAMARRLMHVQLELGGKDPAYVMDNCDVAVAARSLAQGSFYNSGQSCCSVERIYVHHGVYSAFVDQFVAAVAQFEVGDPLDPKTHIGPLARRQQLAVLSEQVQNCEAKGGRIVCGGKPLPGEGNFFAPTVALNVSHDMLLMREESFGPIVGIESVQDDVEAVRKMNDTAYGLSAAVFGRDAKRARKILEQAQTGTVYYNCCDRVSVALPWSGRRHSGTGSTLSHVGIRALLQPKAWHWLEP